MEDTRNENIGNDEDAFYNATSNLAQNSGLKQVCEAGQKVSNLIDRGIDRDTLNKISQMAIQNGRVVIDENGTIKSASPQKQGDIEK